MTQEHADQVELRARELIRDHVNEANAQGYNPHMTWEQAVSIAHQEFPGQQAHEHAAEEFDVEVNRGIYVQQQQDGKRRAIIELGPDVRPQSFDYLARILGMWDLHLKKATGYSGHSPDVWANFRTDEALGIPDDMGVYIRMNDKFNRLKSLVQNPERDQVNEPIEDLLQDIAAYAIIALCLRAEHVNG